MKKLATAVLTAILLSRPVWALPSGALAGRVLPGPDRPEARAVLVAPASDPGAALRAPVGADGSFRIDGVPAGQADLAVETESGLYVVATPVSIAPGATRNLQLALGRQDTSPPPGEKKAKRAGGVWANPLYATLIVVGAAVVVGVAISALTETNSHPASPSSSSQ
ncbi:MAG TPA: carboxypeptidase-like regulatory domain-containing protein [Candidatus Polarisedimenticolaceae bacterium]|nr:carboxypeptidase-like regulatory domain-containing protein [Candidatus Polarisedimenticolaceae bacterium]